MFSGDCKRILLGICGGIAAYKTPILVRELRARGCDVRVAMTAAACEFVTPLTLQAVSGHAVHRELLDADAESGMGHIELARWADAIVIAPASANFLAKMANGFADDLLSAVVLARGEGEVTLAPAMNEKMWANAAVRRNVEALAAAGVRVLGPDVGAQACGDVGPGRMPEPAEIADAMMGEEVLAGARVLVSAGPTWEAMDPVRGLTNRSSGKMGFAMAAAAVRAGARVSLVAGPVALATPAGVSRVDVTSAGEMLDAVLDAATEADVFIGVAAVADYRPAEVAARKIKKGGDEMRLGLVKNADILAAVAALPNAPYTLGFAAETENAVVNARGKLREKGVDAIAVNRVGDGAVFGGAENAVTLVTREGEVALPRADKLQLARQIIGQIAAWRDAKKTRE